MRTLILICAAGLLLAPATARAGDDEDVRARLVSYERLLSRCHTDPAAIWFVKELRELRDEHPDVDERNLRHLRLELLAESRNDRAARYFVSLLDEEKPPAPAAGSPEEMFEAMKRALLGGDAEALYEMIPPGDRKRIADRETAVRLLREALRELNREPDRIRETVLVSSKVGGDRCTLTVRTDDDEDDVELIRVDGRWYWPDVKRILRFPEASADVPEEPAWELGATLVYEVDGPTEGLVEAVNARLRGVGQRHVNLHVRDGARLEVALSKAATEKTVERVKALLARPGSLEFMVVAKEGSEWPERKHRESRGEEYEGPRKGFRWVPLRRPADVPDRLLETATVFRGEDLDPDGLRAEPSPVGPGYQVLFSLKEERREAFADFSEQIIGRQLAIVIEGGIESAPVVRDRLPGRAIITGGGMGGFSKEEAEDLVNVLRSGPLPAKLILIEEEKTREK
jgi:hypothetical protein